MLTVRQAFRYTVRVLALAAMVASSASCDDDDEPTGTEEPFQAIGTWRAVVFVVNVDGTNYDVLDEGGSITLLLFDGGASGGSYLVPQLGDYIGEAALLEGTWWITQQNRLHIEHDGDSFLRRLVFVGGEDQLESMGVIDGMEVHVVLQRD